MPRLAVILVAVLVMHGCSPPDDNGVPPTVPEVAADEAPITTVPGNIQPSRNIVIAADPWCPHNCEAGSDREGYMVDIAREVLTEAGYTVEYVNISWARALQMTREGQLDAVVGAFITDAPDFVFPDTPQGHSTIALFTHPDNHWIYEGLESLNDQKLLVINGYSYTIELDQYIRKNQADRDRIWVISGPSPLERAIYLLDQHRTDLFAEDVYVMIWWAMNGERTITPPRKAGLVSKTDAFVAFSPARDDAQDLAQLLAKGTRERLANGRIREILEQYGLSLWTEMP